jgi:hypothetical protein
MSLPTGHHACAGSRALLWWGHPRRPRPVRPVVLRPRPRRGRPYPARVAGPRQSGRPRSPSERTLTRHAITAPATIAPTASNDMTRFATITSVIPMLIPYPRDARTRRTVSQSRGRPRSSGRLRRSSRRRTRSEQESRDMPVVHSPRAPDQSHGTRPQPATGRSTFCRGRPRLVPGERRYVLQAPIPQRASEQRGSAPRLLLRQSSRLASTRGEPTARQSARCLTPRVRAARDRGGDSPRSRTVATLASARWAGSPTVPDGWLQTKQLG